MKVLYLKLSQPTTFHCPFRIKSVGIKTDAEDEKIAISEDKEQMTIVLGFLDEKVYTSLFSKSPLLANSKQSVKKQRSSSMMRGIPPCVSRLLQR